MAYFYDSGHGVGLTLEEGADSSLVPVHLEKPGNDKALGDHSFPLTAVVRKLRTSGSRLQLVVMEACRDNPFLKGLEKKDTAFQVPRGLSIGSFKTGGITEKKDTAFLVPRGQRRFYPVPDGYSTNDDGVYVAAWVSVLSRSGLELGDLHGELAQQVAARGGMIPRVETSTWAFGWPPPVLVGANPPSW